MQKKTVVVGLSGGVDSAVAAHILKENGYHVIGVTMQIWQEQAKTAQSDGGCCGLSAVDDARRVAQMLDIPYYVMNFRDVFQKTVIDYFIDEYTKGRTPNPCIACNRYVKWEALLNKAMALGADYIATGHYARIITHPTTNRLTLHVSATAAKDQTYALYNLTQNQLAHTLMPVGDFTKEQIRQMAQDIGLLVANKPDSQEICFVPDNDYGRFITQTTGQTFPEGDFVDASGDVLGRHKGIIHYTIGQRKGLGIAFGDRRYVQSIDPVNNTVVLSSLEGLFQTTLVADKVHFMAIESAHQMLHAKAKTRYGPHMANCTFTVVDGVMHLTFDTPQRAITPGQAVVVYDTTGQYILCGGVIHSAH